MSNLKTTDEDAVITVSGNELVRIVQGGVNKKITLAQLLTRIVASGQDGVDITITASDIDMFEGSAGSVDIRGGTTTGADGNGGDISISGGNANASGSFGGAVTIAGGAGYGRGGSISILAGNGAINTSDGGDVTIAVGLGNGGGRNGYYILSNLPTADPLYAGALWNNNGTIKISAG